MIDQNNTDYKKDVNDLNELFKTIWDKKLFISLFTLFVTIGFTVYLNIKTPVPIYQGSLTIEIGKGISLNGGEYKFDNVYTLKNIVEKFYNVSILLPKGTKELVVINSSHFDKNEIKKQIQSSSEFIMERHKSKIFLYEKYVMSKPIGDILIDDVPINKQKKKLIITVTFITSLVFSIFIVFFTQFIKDLKMNKEKL